MNIALAADIRIASEEASFGQNFAKVGLFPIMAGRFSCRNWSGQRKPRSFFIPVKMIDAKRRLPLASSTRWFRRHSSKRK